LAGAGKFKTLEYRDLTIRGRVFKHRLERRGSGRQACGWPCRERQIPGGFETSIPILNRIAIVRNLREGAGALALRATPTVFVSVDIGAGHWRSEQ
jgi:hypothetical protein